MTNEYNKRTKSRADLEITNSAEGQVAIQINFVFFLKKKNEE